MPETAWPEGVIARYLTKAADLTGERITVDITDGGSRVHVMCTACPYAATDYDDPTCEGFPDREAALRRASFRAQAHAGTCRALPKPTA